jgi:hypothetical protein
MVDLIIIRPKSDRFWIHPTEIRPFLDSSDRNPTVLEFILPKIQRRPPDDNEWRRFARVVARSTLRAITFVSARCASLQLTSIAPTHAAVASVAVVVASLTTFPFILLFFHHAYNFPKT